MSELLIYTPTVTPRINYVFSLFFESLINTPYRLTSHLAEYKDYKGPKFNYSEQIIEEGELYIHPVNLLKENDIHHQELNVTEWDGLKIFYQTGGVIPFDVFAASFYLVSRYEEYLAEEADEHKRYHAISSFAFRNKFIDIPLVNLWADKLKGILLAKYPSIQVKENVFTFTPTIDIDVAYAHKGRTISVTLGSVFKALANFQFGFVVKKKLTLLGLRRDGYDTYAYQEEIFRTHKIKPIYFFLAGNRSRYDKNINTAGDRFASLIKKVSSYADVGIHPSYQSESNVAVVKEEIKRVEKHLNGKITRSRQHFLKISLPETYRCLASLGITDDYTMAYASCPGFRASICTPFYFYDLKKEEQLPVRLHPTIVMDGTFNEYMRVTPEEAILIMKKLIEQVKQCKGEFIGIWHNDTLNDKGKWKDWRFVFERMIAMGVK